MTDPNTLQAELTTLIKDAKNLTDLNDARVKALGKKGEVTALMKTLGKMNPDERKEKSRTFNALKNDIAALIDGQEMALKKQEMDARLATETIDITLPIRNEKRGHIHPLSKTIDELVNIFGSMGFQVAEGPDIEDDWHNFTALNFPPGHPAREMQDTFFLPDGHVLRTHTSSVQIRHMEQNALPHKIICFGRTYRSDWDQTHTPMFHQMEALYIDKNVTMAHLKGCLQDFVRAFFNLPDLPVRFRPSFFPFVEPGAEVDIGYIITDNGMKLGQAKDPADQKWLEVLGAGMVHENVLENCNVDTNEYQGFAFGMGLERLTMLKYGIPDLRTFFDSDVRWLDHYGFSTTAA